jgi:hypothetical protein
MVRAVVMWAHCHWLLPQRKEEAANRLIEKCEMELENSMNKYTNGMPCCHGDVIIAPWHCQLMSKRTGCMTSW